MSGRAPEFSPRHRPRHRRLPRPHLPSDLGPATTKSGPRIRVPPPPTRPAQPPARLSRRSDAASRAQPQHPVLLPRPPPASILSPAKTTLHCRYVKVCHTKTTSGQWMHNQRKEGLKK
ncbi:hypothetical protein BRADI_2g22585v3 [Brachypodium distachyon]|uniref:Uncharacterized protein n=1 Tax=Brachypodium distachyon TaxID=15368 RepID=A0A2K2D9W0_BRADI|nr:hypothetical protein BRADI_2g22585v3 [Brachypodium distachyon]